MKLFFKGIAKILFYVITGALLVYAASRSLDFISSTLPPDQQIIGFLALAATSGGVIAWLLVFLYSAEGLGQKIVAWLMVAVDLVGEIALFTFDTLYQSGQSGMTASLLPEEIRAVILGMSALIGLNIVATVAFHLVDSENLRNMRESFVRDRLENEAMKHIERHGEQIARDLGPKLAEQWRADFESRFSDMSALGLGTANEKKPRLTILPAQPGHLLITQPKETAQEDAQATDPLAAPAAIPPQPVLTGFSNNGHKPGNNNGHKE